MTILIFTLLLSLVISADSHDLNFELPCSFLGVESVSKTQASIVFSTFISPEIQSYAQHFVQANYLYASQRQYHSRVLSMDTGDDYFPEDKRWNKILAIPNGLEGWAKGYDALVFIDADLVILNFELSIESILLDNGDADIMMSSDAIDIGNTGFIIVRNTKWAIDFFRSWWDAKGSRFTYCDQHVLNKLWSQLQLEGLTHKIAFLHPRALNSQWPAIESFESTDVVLHLMGEMESFRRSVGQHVTSQICQAISACHSHSLCHSWHDASIQQYIPKQYGLSKTLLVQLAREALTTDHAEKQTALEAAWPLEKTSATMSQAALSSLLDHLKQLHDATTRLCDDTRPYMTAGAALSCAALFCHEFDFAQPRFRQLCLQDMPPDLEDDCISLAEHTTKIVFDSLYFTGSEDRGAAVVRLKSAFSTLQTAVSAAHNHAKYSRFLAHKSAVMHAGLAVLYQGMAQWQAAAEHGQTAVTDITQVLHSCTADNPGFPGYVMQLIDVASRLGMSKAMLGELREAYHWQQMAVSHAVALAKTHDAEKRAVGAQLIALHLTAAELADQLNLCDKAIIHLQDLRHSMTINEITASLDVRRRSKQISNSIRQKESVKACES